MIVGIDLGTTNSLIACYTPDGPKIIPNRLGKNLTPSVVSVDENGQIYVGEAAKERMLLYPDTAAAVFKRDMGSDKKFKLGKVKGVTDGQEFEKEYEFSAVELSSFVLRFLKEDAEHYLGEEITEAVISVPAYFNEQRRKATKQAGELAGLKVDRIISEPTAAAVAYGLYQEKKDSKFLVFDLGGGTFDVSILELFSDILEVHAVAGDNFLGGEDFTQVIVDMFFEKNEGLDRDKLDDKVLRHITSQADKCKRLLEMESYSDMKCNIDDKIYEFRLDAKEYEFRCQDLLGRIKEPIKRSLADAGIKVSDIDKIVLVGGSTKLALIRRFVSRIFRKMPELSINPDEAVALGAAIAAAMKERNEAVKELILTDVCPFTLGTEVAVQIEEDDYESGHYCPIIERNTVIPASRTQRLYTVRDNQKRIAVNVLQGESRFAGNNLLLGTLEVDIPAAKAGEEAIDVTYTYDINSLLEVQVRIVSNGRILKKVFKNQDVNMTDEQIKQRFEEIAYLKIHPRDQEENRLLLLKGERMYEQSLGNDRAIIDMKMQEFEMVLNGGDERKIMVAREHFAKFLERFDMDL